MKDYTRSKMAWICYVIVCLFASLASAANRTLTIVEELPAGTPIMTLSTVASLGYGRNDLFSVKSGHVTLVKRLDYETDCSEGERLTASDGHRCFFVLQILGLADKYVVKVVVKDINDNAPVFQENKQEISKKILSIPENSLRNLSLPKARDPDISSRLTYGLAGRHAHLFRLHVASDSVGGANLLQPLSTFDREVNQRGGYDLQLTVSDQVHEAVLDLVVKITDVNDNGPKFTRSTYTAQVPENLISGSPVISLQASDEDDTAFMNFDLVSGLPAACLRWFRFRPSSGTTTSTSGQLEVATPPDYDILTGDNDQCELTVKVSDGKHADHFAKVIVTITNQNDNSPHLKKTLDDVISIGENLASGTSVIYLDMMDGDRGDEGEFECSLQQPLEMPFRLNSIFDNVYELATSRILDREQRSSYPLTVACLDRGDPPNRAEVQFTVYVADQNDNSPLFAQDTPTMLTVTENVVPTPQASPLYSFTVTDEDTSTDEVNPPTSGLGRGVTLEVNDTRFSVDGMTGALYLAAVLDRETVPEIALLLTARDAGEPQLNATLLLRIEVKDEDDNWPRFTSEVFNFEVEEGGRGRVVLGQVNVVDEDTRPLHNAYSLTCESPPVGVEFDPSGEVSVVRPLTYQTDSRTFECAAVSTWGGQQMTSKCRVAVEVIGVNRHRPKFAVGSSNVTVYAGGDITHGRTLAQFPATDQDTGRNSRLVYTLTRIGGSHSSDAPVVIDSHTGTLKLGGAWLEAWQGAGRVDPLPQPTLYCLNVTDSGERPLWTTLYFVLVFNASSSTPMAFPPIPGQSSLAKPNYTVVVVILAVSGVLSLILLAAIAFVFRRKRADRKWMETYKNRQIVDRQSLAESSPSPDSLSYSGTTTGMSNANISNNNINNNNLDSSSSLEINDYNIDLHRSLSAYQNNLNSSHSPHRDQDSDLADSGRGSNDDVSAHNRIKQLDNLHPVLPPRRNRLKSPVSPVYDLQHTFQSSNV